MSEEKTQYADVICVRCGKPFECTVRNIREHPWEDLWGSWHISVKGRLMIVCMTDITGMKKDFSVPKGEEDKLDYHEGFRLLAERLNAIPR